MASEIYYPCSRLVNFLSMRALSSFDPVPSLWDSSPAESPRCLTGCGPPGQRYVPTTTPNRPAAMSICAEEDSCVCAPAGTSVAISRKTADLSLKMRVNQRRAPPPSMAGRSHRVQSTPEIASTMSENRERPHPRPLTRFRRLSPHPARTWIWYCPRRHFRVRCTPSSTTNYYWPGGYSSPCAHT
jgi:hypothetical protein